MSIKDNEDACQRCDGVFKSKEGKILCDNCLKDIAPDLWQELKKQSKELEELKEYVTHYDSCDLGNNPDSFDTRHFKCTCGLEELLKRE